MKKISCLALIIIMMMNLTGCGETLPKFETAKEASINFGAGISFGNTLDASSASMSGKSVAGFETGWGNPSISPLVVDKFKEVGFNTIRIPVTWTYHIDAEGNIDEEWLSRVKEVVDYVIDRDMYCILNVHHDTGENGWMRADKSNYELNSAKFANLWTQLSETFKDYSDKLLFEGFNEILDTNNEWNSPTIDSLEAVNMYNQLFVDTVRKTGSNNATRNLIVNTYAAGSNDTILSGFTLPADTVKDHLLVEIHSYEPWGFTSTTATWTTMTDVFSDDLKPVIDTTLKRLDKYFLQNGIPVIWGEYGAEIKGNDEERIKYVTYLNTQAKEYSIPCVYWDNGTTFQIMSRYLDESRHQPVAEAIIEASK